MVHKAGFTLVETLFALAIVALMLPALYTLQGSVLRSVTMFYQEYERILLAKQFWQELHPQEFLEDKKEDKKNEKKEDKKLELKKITDPVTELRYEQTPVGGNSSLSKLKGLAFERITISWKSVTGKESTEQLIGLKYEPPKEDV